MHPMLCGDTAGMQNSNSQQVGSFQVLESLITWGIQFPKREKIIVYVIVIWWAVFGIHTKLILYGSRIELCLGFMVCLRVTYGSAQGLLLAPSSEKTPVRPWGIYMGTKPGQLFVRQESCQFYCSPALNTCFKKNSKWEQNRNSKYTNLFLACFLKIGARYRVIVGRQLQCKKRDLKIVTSS